MRFLVVGATELLGAAFCRTLVRETYAVVLGLGRHRDGLHRAALSMIAAHARFSFRHLAPGDMGRLAALLDVIEPTHVVHVVASADAASEAGEVAAVRATTARYWLTLPPLQRGAMRYVPVYVGPQAPDRIGDAVPHDAMPEIAVAVATCFGPFAELCDLVPTLVIEASGPSASSHSAGGDTIYGLIPAADAASALGCIAMRGHPGACYAIPATGVATAATLIAAIASIRDRHGDVAPGIDVASDGGRVRPGLVPVSTLGWRPALRCSAALVETVAWYRANGAWKAAMRDFTQSGRDGAATPA